MIPYLALFSQKINKNSPLMGTPTMHCSRKTEEKKKLLLIPCHCISTSKYNMKILHEMERERNL
jgi:hypothetical protein